MKLREGFREGGRNHSQWCMLGKRGVTAARKKKGTGGREWEPSIDSQGSGLWRVREGWCWYRSVNVSYRDDELLLNNMCVRGRKAMMSMGSGCTWMHIHGR